MIPRDNTMSINTLTTTKMCVPHNRPSHDPSASLLAAKQKLKMMSIGMIKYTLDSITTMPISPKSYDRPLDKMKFSASTMTMFGTFVQASVPLKGKKEEQAIKDWIYKGEEDIVTITTPISPKNYGKHYEILQQMGYQGQGPLRNNRHTLAKPLSCIDGQQPKDNIGQGYGAKDDLPKCSRDAPMTNDSDTDMDESLLYAMAQMGDSLPSTSLLWGEECTLNDDTTEASTSRGNEPNESNFRDR